MGGLQGSVHRGGHTAVDGNRLLAEFYCVKRILNPLVDGHVASHNGDGLNLYSRVAHRHNQRDRVIGSGVRIYNEVAHHVFPFHEVLPGVKRRDYPRLVH
ncbi:MAG: hypothetical protein WA997_12520 [Anaerolineales bacterium]